MTSGPKRPLQIGLLIDSITGYVNRELIDSMQAIAIVAGHQLLILPGKHVNAPTQLDRQFNMVYALGNSPRLDAIVSATAYWQPNLTHAQTIAFLRRYDAIPTVSINFDLPGSPCVVLDNRTGMRELLHHLAHTHGYHRMAFMKGPEGNADADERFQVFRSFLEEAGLAFDPQLVVTGNFSHLDARVAMAELLDRRLAFDVLVAANDGMAYAAMAVALERGLRVPQDFAVTGFDDVQAYLKEGPQLTTVSQPVRVSGSTAMNLVFALLRGDAVPHLTTLPTRLVTRLSCGCGTLSRKSSILAPPQMESTREEQILGPLNLPPNVLAQYREFLRQLEQSLLQGERAFEDRVSAVARLWLMQSNDISQLQALLLSMHRNRRAAELLTPQGVSPSTEYLLDGLLILSNAKNILNAAQTTLSDSSDYSFKDLNFLKRQMQGSGHDEIMRLVESALHEFKIPSAYLVLYDKTTTLQERGESEVPPSAQVVFAMTQAVRHTTGTFRPFPTSQLLPKGMGASQGHRVYALFPIFQNLVHYGYMVLDLTQMPRVRLETLRDEISSTLIHSILVGQVERTRDALKIDLHTATDSNTKLFSEVMALNRRLQALLDAAQEVAIIATDSRGMIQVFNLGAEKMLGYSSDEVLGSSATRFHLQEEIVQRSVELSELFAQPISGFETFVAMARNGNSETRNWTYLRKDGRHINVSLVVSAVHDEQGHLNGFLGIARDITEQVAAQIKLVNLNSELDQRVKDRTHALHQSNQHLADALEHLQQTKKNLVESEKLAALGSIVAAVAHELNTPIGNCLMVASSMQEGTLGMQQEIATGTMTKSRLGNYLHSMNDGVTIMLRGLERSAQLINNFKQVSVIRANEQRSRFDLCNTLEDIVALTRLTLHSATHHITLTASAGIAMHSYAGSLEKIISNLVSNSVLHGFDGLGEGNIHLSAQREGDNVRMVFSDNGVGMDATILQRVFDPFFTTKLGKGGNGLGMSICYNLVVGLLGGSIEVASTPGQGCTFTMLIPCVAPERATPAAAPGNPSAE